MNFYHYLVETLIDSITYVRALRRGRIGSCLGNVVPSRADLHTDRVDLHYVRSSRHGGVWVIDYGSRQVYKVAVIMAPWDR
jgi:hypothetical protein